jgi:ribonucleoside-diphosphate reductase alpha chain
VRALGSYIKGTNGKSQGVVPFLKVVNDTAVAVNQGGKRKGAVCAYLETWHLDIEEFLELRKNTGDDRRRTHDMNTANWIPDLFMKRVMEGGEWTLFSPSTCPDLHDKFGRAFERPTPPTRPRSTAARSSSSSACRPRTCGARCCRCCSRPAIPGSPSRTPATCAARSSTWAWCTRSNLCTEITLNTSDTEIAVCNLGSVNLAQHLKDGKQIDQAKLKKTVATAMRMLDNVIDINYYAVKKARDSNLRHRPVGLGIMGFQDCLYQLRVPYASAEAVEFADRSMEPCATTPTGPAPSWPPSAAATAATAAACGTAASCRRTRWTCWPSSAAACRGRPQRHAGLGRAAPAHRRARHAQQQLRGHRADRHHQQHHRRRRLDRAELRQPVGQVQPVGRVHRRQRVPGARPQALGLWDDVMVMDLKHFDGSLRPSTACPRS